MKIGLVVLILLISSVTNASALVNGGDKIGNGGGGQICRNAEGRLLPAKSYDLVEGVFRYGYDIDLEDTRSADVIEKELWTRVRAAVPGYEALLKLALAEVDARWTPQAITLAQTNDAHPILFQQDCEFVQIADWNDYPDKIFVNQAVYNEMLPVHQLALKWHEAIYFLERMITLADDSDSARYMVATLFQKDLTQFPNVFANTRGKIGLSYCDARRKFCYLNWKNPEDYAFTNQYRLQVKRLSPIGKVDITVPGGPTQKLGVRTNVAFDVKNQMILIEDQDSRSVNYRGEVTVMLKNTEAFPVKVNLSLVPVGSAQNVEYPVTIPARSSTVFGFHW